MTYPHGLFSWTDIALPDPKAGAEFYQQLFVWESQDARGPDGDYIYTGFSKDGKAVAGIGPMPPGMSEAGAPPMWNSYVTVEDLDATIDKWTAGGGSIILPAMEVMTAGRMAVGMDPEGGVVSMWEAGDSVGGELFNVPGAMTWNELATRNSAAARSFYGDVFGWDFEPFGGDAPGEYWVIRLDKPEGGPFAADGYNGGILTMDDQWPAEVPAHWMVYFNVADVDDTIERLTGLGGSVSVPAFDTPAGRIAVVGDPQGGTFSIICPPQPE